MAHPYLLERAGGPAKTGLDFCSTMKTRMRGTVLLCIVFLSVSCKKNDVRAQVEIPLFTMPSTVVFDSLLSAYQVYQGSPSKLAPTATFEVLELSAPLFTDYAYKQRLLRLPEGAFLTRSADGTFDFPDGTVLVKTFFYWVDERDTSLGKRLVETRLEIKEDSEWNLGTYVWNEAQTDASLKLDGGDLTLTWVDLMGRARTNQYHVPTKNECIACHQSSGSLSPIGPTLRNLNRLVVRGGLEVNQLSHLQSKEWLESFPLSAVPQIVDYQDTNAPLSSRARSYLAMNCAHCHQPNAWDVPAQQGFDFRYHIPLEFTGILEGKDQIERNVTNGEMPFLGTTLQDEQGIALLTAYLNGL